MAKKLIRLTESDLHRIVKESVRKVLKEGFYDRMRQLNGETDKEDKGNIFYGVDKETPNVYRGITIPSFCNAQEVISKIDVCLDEKGWSPVKTQKALNDYLGM